MSNQQEINNKMAWNAYNNLYICEPDKNTECKKSDCFKNGGPCYMTTKREFAKGADERQDIKRLKFWLTNHPDAELWIIGGTHVQAEICQTALKQYGVDRKTRLFSQGTKTIDGLNQQKAIIVLYENWWKSPIADTDAFQWYLDNALHVMQIGEL